MPRNPAHHKNRRIRARARGSVDARAAERAEARGLEAAPAPLSVGVFVSPAVRPVDLVAGEKEIGCALVGRRYDAIEVHATQSDVAHPAFGKWLSEARTRLDGTHVADAVKVWVYPHGEALWRHEHTSDEVRVLRAIANMPGGALEAVWKHGRRVATSAAGRPVPIDHAHLASYLEALIEQIAQVYRAEGEAREELSRLRRDVEGMRRLLGVSE